MATQIGYVPKYAKPSGIYSDSIAKLGYKKAIEEGVGPKEFGDWLKKDGSIFKESHPDYADTLSKELQISEWDKIYPSENLDVKGRNTEEKQREALNTLMGEVDAAKALGNNKISIESDLTTNYIKNKDKYDDLGITNLEDYKDFLDKAISLNEGGIARLGYKDGEMVTVPKHWQSAPDHPKTELAYITKPEKDLLVKKDLHNSLKDGPNVGPGGVMSLNGGDPIGGYGPGGSWNGGNQSGNQGGNQGNQPDTTENTTTTFNSPSFDFSPTYDYTPPKKDSLLDDFVDTYRDLTTFNTPLGELSITPGLKSVEATLSFSTGNLKKGGLLDRSRKK